MNNKTSIIECAVKLFASKGYDAVSVQEITTEANITKPTLYYYFGSKEGLLQEVIKVNFEDMKAKVYNIKYNKDIPLSLYTFIKEYFSYTKQNIYFCKMKLSLMYSFTENSNYYIIEKMLNEEMIILEKFFISAANDNGNMKGRHKEYAASLLGMINSYVGLFFTNSIELNKDLAFKVAHQFMHGIFS